MLIEPAALAAITEHVRSAMAARPALTIREAEFRAIVGDGPAFVRATLRVVAAHLANTLDCGAACETFKNSQTGEEIAVGLIVAQTPDAYREEMQRLQEVVMTELGGDIIGEQTNVHGDEELRQEHARGVLRKAFDELGPEGVLSIDLECRASDGETRPLSVVMNWPDGIPSAEVTSELYRGLTERGLIRFIPEDMYLDLIMHFVISRFSDPRTSDHRPAAAMYAHFGLTSMDFATMLKSLNPKVVRIVGSSEAWRIRDPDHGLRIFTHTEIE